jgi:hypothetical protein
VKYVGKVVGKRKEFRICLLHVLPPMPSELLEQGGSEDPMKESRLGVNQKTEQHRWISAAKKASQKSLDGARPTLQTVGVSAGTVKALSYEPGENQDAADIIPNVARGSHCRPVVVGRQSASSFQELFREPLAAKLHRRGKEFSVWAIE